MHRERETLDWQPSFDGALYGWTVNFINQNRWRCDSIHTFADLLQDAYLTFRRICDSYPRVIDKRHFFSLYRRAMVNEMHDKARYKKRKNEANHITTELDVAEMYANTVGEASNAGYLIALVEELPAELKLVVQAFGDAEKLEQMRHPRPQTQFELLAGLDNLRENFNMKMRRILGIDSDTDLAGQLKSYLGNS